MSGPLATAFALRYQEIKVGTGAEGEAGKLWHIKYTGWRAADGVKFDSWDDHRQPLLDKDGKPQMGPDGKPVLGEPQPLGFPQGMGHVIPGFDFGLTGMRIGGKRRLFIPWQMAYGVHNLPDRPDHPGIPPKSDLIFDVELVDVTELPAMPTGMPGGMPHPVPQPGGSGNAAPPPSSTQPSAPPQSQQSAPPQSQPK
jgi:peptidylprolyl isomerase